MILIPGIFSLRTLAVPAIVPPIFGLNKFKKNKLQTTYKITRLYYALKNTNYSKKGHPLQNNGQRNKSSPVDDLPLLFKNLTSNNS